MDTIVLQTPEFEPGRGAPEASVPGGDIVAIRGVEAMWEFNGLYLNVRDWIETYLVRSISGLDDSDIRDAREVNPSAHGETPFPAFYGGRTMVFQGKIITRTLGKLRDMEYAMRKAFAPLVEMPLIMRTNDVSTDLFIMCRKSQKIEKGEEQTTQNHFERPFQITLRASNPWFLSYLQEHQTTDLTPGSAYTIVTNKGTFEAQPSFELTGPMSAGSYIINNDNGHRLVLGVDIPNGDIYTIDTANSSVVDNSTGMAVDGGVDSQSDDFRLVADLNNHVDYIISGSGSNSEATIKWRHTYL